MNQEDAEGLDILRKACPDLSDEQLKEAKNALDQYLEVVMLIYDRIMKDPRAYEKFKAVMEERNKELR